MDIKKKVVEALRRAVRVDHVRLEDDDGVTGYVVSPDFVDVPMIDRQETIDKALDKAALSDKERRRVLMIAALTPVEHDSAGIRIRVHKVRELACGGIEIWLRGGDSDAQYVRGLFSEQAGCETTEPKPVSGAEGILMKVRAKGSKKSPLTKATALQLLNNDRYIEVALGS